METIDVRIQQGTAQVILQRPQVRNALNPVMIRELRQAFESLGADPAVRAIVLAAGGTSFCAGADLNWMREAARAEDAGDIEALAGTLRAIYECPKPTIARVQGAAFGGGVGLVAACDLSAALETAVFCFSEVKLGLVPAVISPFVLRRALPSAVRRYCLTAERFDAAEAKRIGLLSECAPTAEELDGRVERWCGELRAGGPEALATCKRLLEEAWAGDLDSTLPVMAARLAERRRSDEGQEGIRAFLEKRPPRWAADGADVP